MDHDLAEARLEFINESTEMLEQVSLSLAKIERQIDAHQLGEVLNQIYRDVHTIKGSAQLFGFASIGIIAHAMEASLDPLRKKFSTMTRPLADLIFEGIDLISQQLAEVQRFGKEADMEIKINDFIPRLLFQTVLSFGGTPYVLKEELPEVVAYISEEAMEKEATMEAQKDLPKPSAEVEVELKKDLQGASDQADTIRVGVGLLDNLMNLIGELVLIRNQVVQVASDENHPVFKQISQQINSLTSQLQNEVMKTRMQPIGNILTKFSRMVRDLSQSLGKSAELVLSGTDTELDKALIEAIKGPLTHIVRNALDHGLEAPSEREKLNKDPTGKVYISSFYEDGQMVIEIKDDGRGLDAKALSQKALAHNLTSEEELTHLSEKDIFQFIFHPGFSTKEEVSNVSGRGVGMDVVKTQVERIGGHVDLSSKLGQGTTIRLKIPLTLAIVPSLIIACQNQSFALPQVRVVELLRLDPDEINLAKIEHLQGRPMIRLRGKLLPLAHLKDILQIGIGKEDPKSQNIVVLKDESQHFGVIVDRIIDSAEVVIKPLASILGKLPMYTGAAVLGNGSIALALDTAYLIASESDAQGAQKTLLQKKEDFIPKKEYLLIDLGNEHQYGILLDHVHRLEEIPATTIRVSGASEVVDYRGTFLPLVDLSAMVTGNVLKNEEKTPVVVIKGHGRLIGYKVAQILDVLRSQNDVLKSLKQGPLIQGTIVEGEEIFPILNLDSLVKKSIDTINWPEKSQQVLNLEQVQKQRKKHPSQFKILCAEDSQFFRQQLCQMLKRHGFATESAEDGKKALALMEKAKEPFSLLITDIEMPEMDGVELTKAVRNSKQFAQLPIIAVTTRFRKADIEKGLQSGMNRYLEKLNEDQIIRNIKDLLGLEKSVA